MANVGATHVILFGQEVIYQQALLPPRMQTSFWPDGSDLCCHRWPATACIVSCTCEGIPSGRRQGQPSSFACKLYTGCQCSSQPRVCMLSLTDCKSPLLCRPQSEGTPDAEEMSPVVKRSGWKPPKDTGLWGIADRVGEQVGC